MPIASMAALRLASNHSKGLLADRARKEARIGFFLSNGFCEMGKRDTSTQLKLTAILWAALGYFSKKSVNRDDIPISEPTRVDVTIEGKIGRSKISERLCCDLVRNPDTSRASSAGAPMPELIAYLFDQFDETRRYQIQQDVLDYWEAGATVPDVPAEAVTATKNWLSQLRTKDEQPVAGSIVATMVEAT